MSNSSQYASENEGDGVVAIPFRPRRDDREEFHTLFREGMSLVEKTANYLDGAGRREAKCLQPYAALAYATESMRLTTRLTQIATWLLARRAIMNGDQPPRTRSDLNPLDLPPVSKIRGSRGYEELPPRLRGLIEDAYRFHQKLSAFNGPRRSHAKTIRNPVALQIERLQSAFS